MKLEANRIACSAHDIGFCQFFAQLNQEMKSAIRFSTVPVYIFRAPISSMLMKSRISHLEVRLAQVYSFTNLSALSTRRLIPIHLPGV